MKKKIVRVISVAMIIIVAMTAMSVFAFADSGNVAGAIEGTWKSASGQIKQVVNNVVFPIIDTIYSVCRGYNRSCSFSQTSAGRCL